MRGIAGDAAILVVVILVIAAFTFYYWYPMVAHALRKVHRDIEEADEKGGSKTEGIYESGDAMRDEAVRRAWASGNLTVGNYDPETKRGTIEEHPIKVNARPLKKRDVKGK